MVGRAQRRQSPSPVLEGAARPTARQAEILQLIAQGRSNKEIARHLGLTEGTVKQHLYTLYRKLGVRNRTQALREGARWIKPAAEAPEAPPPSVYARRLVTAVVVTPHPDASGPLSDGAALEQAVAAMRRNVEGLAQAFDGVAERLSGGGMAAWFGHPTAHGDDVARAVAFARALRGARLDELPLPCSLGMATAAELMGEGREPTVASRTLRTAALLSALAHPGMPLACGLTARYAALPPPGPDGRSPPEGAVPLAPQAAPSASVAREWGGLPFCAELVAAAHRRRAQWLAVESWPPEDGTRLLAAIGEYLAARGLLVRTLWAPARTAGEACISAFLRQLDPDAAEVAGQGERSLADALARLAEKRLALVVVHGIDALATLKDALGAPGIARLKDVPLMIAAGAMQRGREAQTSVRLLGSNPIETPFIRVLRMTVPASPARPDLGVRPDVQAVIDTVSTEARAVARAAAAEGAASLDVLALRLGLSLDDVRKCCSELEQAGLLLLDADIARFRDDLTAAAVRASMS